MNNDLHKLNKLSDGALEQVSGGVGRGNGANDTSNENGTPISHKCPNPNCPSKNNNYMSDFILYSGGRAQCQKCQIWIYNM